MGEEPTTPQNNPRGPHGWHSREMGKPAVISVDVELRSELNQIASFQFRQFFSLLTSVCDSAHSPMRLESSVRTRPAAR
jgi:hypothetical protein